MRVAVVNDYEIVVAGVAAVLARYPDRIDVVELDSGMPVASDVDVILYDTFGQAQGDALDVTALVRDSAKLLIFSWNVDEDLVRRALDLGACGYVPKGSRPTVSSTRSRGCTPVSSSRRSRSSPTTGSDAGRERTSG